MGHARGFASFCGRHTRALEMAIGQWAVPQIWAIAHPGKRQGTHGVSKRDSSSTVGPPFGLLFSCTGPLSVHSAVPPFSRPSLGDSSHGMNRVSMTARPSVTAPRDHVKRRHGSDDDWWFLPNSYPRPLSRKPHTPGQHETEWAGAWERKTPHGRCGFNVGLGTRLDWWENGLRRPSSPRLWLSPGPTCSSTRPARQPGGWSA